MIKPPHNQLIQRLFLVSGKVQGVWFRQSTMQLAQQLNISGYAKNLTDGTVEVFAVGTVLTLQQLTEFLMQGPAQARVDNLTVTTVSMAIPDDFTVA